MSIEFEEISSCCFEQIIIKYQMSLIFYSTIKGFSFSICIDAPDLFGVLRNTALFVLAFHGLLALISAPVDGGRQLM